MNVSRILVILACLLPTVVAARQFKAGKFRLKADLTGYKSQPSLVSVTIFKPGGGFIFDSTEIINRKFVYEREMDQPAVMVLAIKLKSAAGNGRGQGGVFDYLPVFAIPSENTVKLSDSLLTTSIINGPSGNLTVTYNRLTRFLDSCNQIGYQILNAERRAGEVSEDRSRFVNDSVGFIADNYYRQFVEQHPTSPVATHALLQYANRPVWTPRKNLQPDSVDRLLKLLPADFKELPAIKALSENLIVARKTMKGNPVMDFTLPDTAGNLVSLSQFKGKYVLLDFWASWCVPCRKENPLIVKLYNKYKDKGFTVVSVSMDKAEARKAWLEAIQKDGLGDWTQLCDVKGFAGEAAMMYYIKSIPTNFLIDPDGKFISRNLYGESLSKALDKIFASGNEQRAAQRRTNPALDSMLNEKNETALHSRLSNLLSSNNEIDANLALQYYARKNDVSNWEKAKEVVLQRFPMGSQARTDAVNKLYNETDAAAKEQLYKDYEAKFKAAPGSMVAFDVAAAYAGVKTKVNKEKVIEYYNIMSGQGQVDNLKLVVIQNLLLNGETQLAAKLTKETLDQLRAIVTSAAATSQAAEPGRPVADPRMDYNAFRLMYAKVLGKQGNHREALSYAREAYAANKRSNDAQTVYITALIANNELGEAFPLLEKQYRRGSIAQELKKRFRDAYLAVKGSDKGYNDLMVSIGKELTDSATMRIARLKGNLSDAPAFTLKNTEGKVVSLASLKGKIVVLDFWATWCGPCKKSFPAMQLAVNKYKEDKSVVFLFIDTWERMENPLPEVRKFIKENRYTFNVLMDLKNPSTQKCDVIESYKVSGIPTKFIIDKNGKIAFRMTGFEGGDDASVAEITAMIESVRA
ncbi:MAG: redoxin domain-containing protein [Pseudobacter sp.]|uniref:redoxin domain-containing protein n=1 Tax=Pseudobacter sp. TaxID=2045420 RepID=UPI003F7CF0D4